MTQLMAAGVLLLWLPLAAAFERAEIPGTPVLPAFWQAAAQPGARPAVMLLHGCSGLFTRGRIDARYEEYAARFNTAGWHALAPDSFAARGKRSICNEPNATRTITVRVRREDVLRTFAWLAARGDVDPTRIAIVGWSHGAMTLLESIDVSHWPSEAPDARPVAAAAFYPGCSALLRRADYLPAAPLLMLLGEKDDWTPPARCLALEKQLRAREPAAPLTLVMFADSYHGFDSRQPLRFRADVPNGVAKTGVHVGGNPPARVRALQLLDEFLDRYLRE